MNNSEHTKNISEKLRRFLTNKQVGVIGFMIAIVLGTSTNELIRAITDDLIIPFISYFLKIKSLATMEMGGFKIGHLLVTIITYIIMFLVVFIFVEYFLKYVVIPDVMEEKTQNYFEKKYQTNILPNILKTEEILHYNVDPQKAKLSN